MLRMRTLLATLLLPALAVAQTTTNGTNTTTNTGSAGWGWLWFVVIVAAIIIGLFAWSASSGSRTPPNTTMRP